MFLWGWGKINTDEDNRIVIFHSFNNAMSGGESYFHHFRVACTYRDKYISSRSKLLKCFLQLYFNSHPQRECVNKGIVHAKAAMEKDTDLMATHIIFCSNCILLGRS